MCWNDSAAMTLDVSGVHTTRSEMRTTIVENVRMDDKEMALGTHKDGDNVNAFFQVGLELESTGSGRQRGADGTRWRR